MIKKSTHRLCGARSASGTALALCLAAFALATASCALLFPGDEEKKEEEQKEERGPNQDRTSWGWYEGPSTGKWYISDSEVQRVEGLEDEIRTVWKITEASADVIRTEGYGFRRALELKRTGEESWTSSAYTSSMGGWSDFPFALIKVGGSGISFTGRVGRITADPSQRSWFDQVNGGKRGIIPMANIDLILQNIENNSDVITAVTGSDGSFTADEAIPTDTYEVQVAADNSFEIKLVPQKDNQDLGIVAPPDPQATCTVDIIGYQQSSNSPEESLVCYAPIQGWTQEVSFTYDVKGLQFERFTIWTDLYMGDVKINAQSRITNDQYRSQLSWSIPAANMPALSIPADPGYIDTFIDVRLRIRDLADYNDNRYCSKTVPVRIYGGAMRLASFSTYWRPVVYNWISGTVITPDGLFRNINPNYYQGLLPLMKGTYFVCLAIGGKAGGSPLEYRIDASVYPASVSEDAVPSNSEETDAGSSRSRATPIPMDTLVQGKLDSSTDIDMWSITIQ